MISMQNYYNPDLKRFYGELHMKINEFKREAIKRYGNKLMNPTNNLLENRKLSYPT